MPDQDFISRAARFFVLAEQASRFRVESDQLFWDLSVPLEPAPQLPAMAGAVRKKLDPYILRSFAFHPLSGVLPPEAVPWHNRVVAAWEIHHASSYLPKQNLARLALVRLDGCGMPDGQERPSRLPEWLAEAQKIASGNGGATGRSPVLDGEWRVAGARGSRHLDWDRYQELKALAALAAWRPAVRVITPPEVLRAWADFWMEMGRSKDPVEKGIAAIALLNLPGAALRAASIPSVPTAQLLHELATAIQVAAEKKDIQRRFTCLSLLDWQPVKESTWPAAEVTKVAQTWLETTRHKESGNRRAAWRQLIRWNRAGRLAVCGMDLLPELVKAVQTEGDGYVLWEMSQWLPAAELSLSTGMPGRHSLLQQLEGVWEKYRTSGYFYERASGWLAGIRLQQAGLAAEPPESFLKDYLSIVAKEYRPYILLVLAQWSPGADAPGTWHREWNVAWQRWLLDGSQFIRQIAAFALLRHSLENGPDRSLRGTALEMWRVGTKASSEAGQRLSALFARFQEVRARLAAGEVPDFQREPSLPAERCCPPLALPPGRIADNEWKMENGELKMNNGKWRMQHQEATPNQRLAPDNSCR